MRTKGAGITFYAAFAFKGKTFLGSLYFTASLTNS